MQQQQQQRRTADPILSLQVPPSSSSNVNRDLSHSSHEFEDDDNEDDETNHQKQENENFMAGNRTTISAVCFLSSPTTLSTPKRQTGEQDEHDVDDSTDDDDEELNLRCQNLNFSTMSTKSHHLPFLSSNVLLSGMILGSCHTNGDAFLWDLGRRRIVLSLYDQHTNDSRRPDSLNNRPRGSGITLRRLGDGMRDLESSSSSSSLATSQSFLFHTRDPEGTVSIHEVESSSSSPDMPVITSFATYSRTFCAAAPCWGDANLIVVPTEHTMYATVRDIRCSPSSTPAIGPFPAAPLNSHDNNYDDGKQYGMLTSLAMAASTSAASDVDYASTGARYVVACGTESGHVFYHDMAMPRHSLPTDTSTLQLQSTGHVQLGNAPVLGLDMAASSSLSPLTSEGEQSRRHSVVTIAGLAGDAADLSELPLDQQGTVALLKTSFSTSSNDEPTIRIRSRWNTCDIQDPIKRGKPGVAVCRFRPDDGRLVAVGSWDYRLRIYDRAKSTATASTVSSSSPPSALYAILKGHAASVTAVDWAPSSGSRRGKGGILATGAKDGQILIWNLQ